MTADHTGQSTGLNSNGSINGTVTLWIELSENQIVDRCVAVLTDINPASIGYQLLQTPSQPHGVGQVCRHEK